MARTRSEVSWRPVARGRLFVTPKQRRARRRLGAHPFAERPNKCSSGSIAPLSGRVTLAYHFCPYLAARGPPLGSPQCSPSAGQTPTPRSRRDRHSRVRLATAVVGVVAVRSALCASAGAQPPLRSWLAAGDSYSSGEGLPHADRQLRTSAARVGLAELGRRRARQDRRALLPAAARDPGWSPARARRAAASSRATSGAPAMGRFDLVTFTLGGNDIRFSPIRATSASGLAGDGLPTDPGHNCPQESLLRARITSTLETAVARSFLTKVARRGRHARGPDRGARLPRARRAAGPVAAGDERRARSSASPTRTSCAVSAATSTRRSATARGSSMPRGPTACASPSSTSTPAAGRSRATTRACSSPPAARATTCARHSRGSTGLRGSTTARAHFTPSRPRTTPWARSRHRSFPRSPDEPTSIVPTARVQGPPGRVSPSTRRSNEMSHHRPTGRGSAMRALTAPVTNRLAPTAVDRAACARCSALISDSSAGERGELARRTGRWSHEQLTGRTRHLHRSTPGRANASGRGREPPRPVRDLLLRSRASA